MSDQAQTDRQQDATIAQLAGEVGRLWTVVIGPDGQNGLRSRIGKIEHDLGDVKRALEALMGQLNGCVSEVDMIKELAELKDLFVRQERRREEARAEAAKRSVDLRHVKFGLFLTAIGLAINLVVG